MLGWDITDYGLGDFEKVGFSLITLRNGNLTMADKYPKTYAEKLLFPLFPADSSRQRAREELYGTEKSYAID